MVEHDEAFAAYFNLADELSENSGLLALVRGHALGLPTPPPITLDDMRPEVVELALAAAHAEGLPWPPQMAAAEDRHARHGWGVAL